MSKEIKLPHAGIVLMVGPSNSGKTTLLNRLVEQGILLRSEIVSSDQFRVLVADTEFIELNKRPKDEQDVLYAEYQLISKKAFEAMDYLLESRCGLGKLTVVDATHLWPEDRRKYIDLARRKHVPIMAIALEIDDRLLFERDEHREQ
ncbi:MAG: ATP-binding protein, partial [Bacillota bacterium]|nr:ATP-binding protein [Bacillota bacterium]